MVIYHGIESLKKSPTKQIQRSGLEIIDTVDGRNPAPADS